MTNDTIFFSVLLIVIITGGITALKYAEYERKKHGKL